MTKRLLILLFYLIDDKSILQVLENVLGFNKFKVIGINRTDDTTTKGVSNIAIDC